MAKAKLQWLRKVLSILLVLFGTSAFSCFICEEAMQMAGFAAYTYQQAQDWDALELHVEQMQSISDMSDKVIKGFGWLNPITFPSFLTYLESQHGYIESMATRARVGNQGVPVCRHCRTSEHMEKIFWKDKDTGDTASAWRCSKCGKSYQPQPEKRSQESYWQNGFRLW